MALRPRADGSVVVKITFGRPASGARSNPATAMSYMDEDTLAVVKRLASEYGSSRYVKLLLNSSPTAAWEAADRAEKGQKASPSGPLEVFGLTTRKKVYGYAPAGLIEASQEAVDQIRGARAEQQWQKSYGKVEQGKKRLTTQLEALEKKYGPQLAGLSDKFEAAVDKYELLVGGGGSPAQIKQAKAQVAKVIAPAARKPGKFKLAARAFLGEMVAESGRERNPNSVARWFGMSDGDVRQAANLAKRLMIGVISPLPGLL